MIVDIASESKVERAVPDAVVLADDREYPVVDRRSKETRAVRSRVYFEQMKGRGTRVLTPPSRAIWTAMRLASSEVAQSERWSASGTDLQSVSGADASSKTHFVMVDAVDVCDGVRQHGDGVVKRSGTARGHRPRAIRAGCPFGRRGSQSDKTESRPLERQRTAPFPQLLLGVALGKRDEDTLTTLADRLARLGRELTTSAIRGAVVEARTELTEVLAA